MVVDFLNGEEDGAGDGDSLTVGDGPFDRGEVADSQVFFGGEFGAEDKVGGGGGG